MGREIKKKSKLLKIKTIKNEGNYKSIKLNNGESYNISMSACADEKNTVLKKQSKLFVECKNGEVQIYPSFFEEEKINIGQYSIDLLIKEITDQSELKSYESLSQFHYKGRRLFGRSSILIATSSTPYLPKVLGYIELTTPFYVNKPRSKVIDTPFKHNGISWKKWDRNASKKYINVFCRIARCVVYPEFRGVGLGQVLVNHAIEFAKTRWQISLYKPLFLEISADMLKYVPFAQSVGMHYIGDTEGNLKRIGKDLGYLLENSRRIEQKEIVSEQQIGIVMQQKARLRKAMKIIEENNLTTNEFLARLNSLTDSTKLKDLQFFNGLISLPKPTYLKGLDVISDTFLIRRTQPSTQKNVSIYNQFKCHVIGEDIVLKDLTLGYNIKPKKDNNTIAIQNAFNIDPNEQQISIIQNLNLIIKPGEIVLITGASGAGKTTLLNLLSTKNIALKKLKVSGDVKFPKNYEVAIFDDDFKEKPLIELFNGNDLKFTLQLMGLVGLSDASVYLKTYSELSKGQQFRAQLAKTIIAGANTLIIDEFCSNLDPITANVVTYRLRRLIKELGITLIVGAAHCDSFIHSLSPNKVLRLSTAWDYEVLDGQIYSSFFKRSKHKIDFQFLELTNLMQNKFLQNTGYLVTSKSGLQKGKVILKSQTGHTIAYISSVEKLKFSSISQKNSNLAGFNSVKSLKDQLLKLNENLKKNSFIYILTVKQLDFKPVTLAKQRNY